MSKVIYEDDGNIVSSRIRIVHGDGVEVLLSNDDIGFISTLWRDEALAVADAIIAEFRNPKETIIKLVGDDWSVDLAEKLIRQIYAQSKDDVYDDGGFKHLVEQILNGVVKRQFNPPQPD